MLSNSRALRLSLYRQKQQGQALGAGVLTLLSLFHYAVYGACASASYQQFMRCLRCPYKDAAEQKARVTYDNILRLSDDPDVNDVIRFLRAREIVHFQRFGEGLRLAKDRMSEKNNVYFTNPSFDR